MANDEQHRANPASVRHPGRVLVTGASGHVGANLTRRLLAEGHRVRILLRPGAESAATAGLPVERVYGDLRERESLVLAVEGCRRVFHCAALVSTIDGNARHRRDIFECNVVGTRNLLEAGAAAGVERTVVTGSFSAVGYDPDDPSAPSSERASVYPFHRAMPYEISKRLVEHECLRAVADGQDVVIAVSCAVIGGHDYKPSRMGRTLCDYVDGRLHACIRGGFEFVAAGDIVEGHLLAMERGRSGQRYIFSTEYLTLDDVLDLFEEASGVRAPRRHLPGVIMAPFAEVASFYLSRFHPRFDQRLTPGAIRLLRLRRHADTTKAREELGYRPRSIREAVRDAYAFHWERGAITSPRARPPEALTPPADRGTSSVSAPLAEGSIP